LARDYADATPKEIAEMLGVDWKPEWNGSTSRDAYEEIVDIATGNTEEGRQIDEDEEYDGTSEAIDHYENYGSQVREHPLFQRAREQQLREEHPSWGITGDLTDRLWKAQDVNDAVLPINLSKGVAHNTMSRNIFEDYGGVDPMVNYTPTFDAISNGTLEKEWERKLLSGDRLAAIRCQMLKLAANLEGVGMSEQADSLERAAR
jgi:hypothetical protein